MKTTEAVTTSSKAFDALVDEEMAKTQCAAADASRRVRAQYPQLAALAFDEPKGAGPKSDEDIRKFDRLVASEMDKSQCDPRTALERVKRAEPELAAHAFRGTTAGDLALERRAGSIVAESLWKLAKPGADIVTLKVKDAAGVFKDIVAEVASALGLTVDAARSAVEAICPSLESAGRKLAEGCVPEMDVKVSIPRVHR